MRELTEQRTREPGGAVEQAGPELTDPGLGQNCGRADRRVQGAAMITSAAGIISLLDEEEPQLKEFALHKLNAVVNDFWAEISESVDKM